MDEFLNKIEEMVTHNAMCYSKDFMETPKEGYEKEFAEAYNEMALVAKLKEIVKEYYIKGGEIIWTIYTLQMAVTHYTAD